MRVALLSIFTILVFTATAHPIAKENRVSIDTGGRDRTELPMLQHHRVWKHWAWPWPKVETQYDNGRMYRQERRAHIKKGFIDWIA